MKKLFIIGGVFIAIFALIVVLNSQANSDKLANNPYDTDDLRQSTIDQLDDENYQNIVLPDELEQQIASGDPTTVYFFSPECQYCVETTPVLMPVADDMDIEVLQYNIMEYEQGWQTYNVESTPTLVHYEDGQEVARWIGAQPKENIELFFNEVVLQ